jgi:hypothetical protein
MGDAKLGKKEDSEFKREERYVMIVGLLYGDGNKLLFFH